jgi:DtxR family Mn-dependent transcriptional regulator
VVDGDGGHALLLEDGAGRSARDAVIVAEGADRQAPPILRLVALTEAIQDYLEKLYWFGEAGIEPTQANLARAMSVSQPSVTEMVRRLVDEGLVRRDERKRIRFTERGDEVARHIVSRHRLIEAFLVQVFGIPWDEVHEEAHTFEHAISPNLEQRMYELLADAKTCPHGHPIGDAPREAGEPLGSQPVGSRVRVLRLENEDPDLLRAFKRAGIEPGDTIAVTGLDHDQMQLATRVGDTAVPVEAAQTVSVAIVERGTGPQAETARIDPSAYLATSSWGR